MVSDGVLDTARHRYNERRRPTSKFEKSSVYNALKELSSIRFDDDRNQLTLYDIVDPERMQVAVLAWTGWPDSKWENEQGVVEDAPSSLCSPETLI